MWSLRFPYSVRVDDLLTIRTLSDARTFVLSLPPDTQRLAKWQNIAELLVNCANTGNSALLAVTGGRLRKAMNTPEVASAPPEKKPPAGSVKRRYRRKLVGLA